MATSKYASNVITGDITNANINTAKKVRDVTKRLWDLYDTNNQAPLLALLSQLSFDRSARNPKHEWFGKDLRPRYDTVAGTITNNGTAAITFAPTNLSYFRINDGVRFLGVTGNTNYGYVSAKGASTITVSSIDGSTTLPTIAAGTNIHITGPSMGGESTMPSGKHVQDTNDYNYPQFLREPATIDLWQLGQENYTGPEEQERSMEDLRAIRVAFEDLLFRGERAVLTGASDGTKYFMRGLEQFLLNDGYANNILDWRAGLTQDQWDQYLIDGPCKYGSQRKLMFLSSSLFLQLHQFEKNEKRMTGRDNVIGISFIKYLAPNGKEIFMHQHHLFDGPYEGDGFIVDAEYISLLPYANNKPFMYLEDVGANDASAKSNEYWLIATEEVSRTEVHGFVHK